MTSCRPIFSSVLFFRVIQLCGLQDLATDAPGSPNGELLRRHEEEAARIEKIVAYSFDDWDSRG